MNFYTLGLEQDILRAIDGLGFEHLTPIQEKAIPEILGGETDFVGLAQTGTGKTAAFGLPMIQLIDFELPFPQGLVLCPTRELCIQITMDLTGFARYLSDPRIVAVYGGASIADQTRQIKKGAQIIVATPGRLLDLIHRGAVKLTHIRYAVLDEADEMLDMGFQEDLNAILSKTPSQKRTWLFSATMPKEAEEIARAYMTDPVEIVIGNRNRSAENISHICYVIKEKERYLALKRIIDYAPNIFGLIFCRTRKETGMVAEKLMKDGYNAEALHGDLSQAQRDYVMKKFRERNLQILVATDVAARGLDVADITHVIHYNLPDEPERYTHRSGRTARAGKSGLSIVFVNTREVRRIADVERMSGVRFSFGKIPVGRAICEKQLYALVGRMVRVNVNEREIEPYLPPVYDALSSFSKEELIQRFTSVEFNRFLDYYRDAPDMNAKRAKAEKARPKAATLRFAKKNGQRLFINMGRLDKIKEGAVTRLICDRSGIASSHIGSIELKREFSFVEVEKRVAERVLKSLKGAMLDGRKIEARLAACKEVFGKKKKKKSKRTRAGKRKETMRL